MHRAIEEGRSEARVNTDKLQNTAQNLHTALESVRQQQIPQVQVDIAGLHQNDRVLLAHISQNRIILEGVCEQWKKESARMGNDHLALSQKFILMETKFLALQNFCVQQQDTIGKLAQNFHEACGTQERIVGRVQGVEQHVGQAVGAINAQVQAQQIQLLNMERTPPPVNVTVQVEHKEDREPPAHSATAHVATGAPPVMQAPPAHSPVSWIHSPPV